MLSINELLDIFSVHAASSNSFVLQCCTSIGNIKEDMEQFNYLVPLRLIIYVTIWRDSLYLRKELLKYFSVKDRYCFLDCQRTDKVS